MVKKDGFVFKIKSWVYYLIHLSHIRYQWIVLGLKKCCTNSLFVCDFRCHNADVKSMKWQEILSWKEMFTWSSYLHTWYLVMEHLYFEITPWILLVSKAQTNWQKRFNQILKSHTVHDKTAELYFLSFCSSVNQNQRFDELCKCWVTWSQNAVIAGCRVKQHHGCRFMVSLPLSWCPLCYPHCNVFWEPIWMRSSFCKYKNFHHKDKSVVRQSYLYEGNSYVTLNFIFIKIWPQYTSKQIQLFCID